jgi:hypothetical protein
MGQQTYVFDAELIGFDGVQRTIAVRDDLALVDLHYALQSAFGWDDDHLYAFWLDGGFWATRAGLAGRRACTPLAALALRPGQRIAYVFDFADEWRVELTVREVVADAGRASPRLLGSVGAAPPQSALARAAA